MSVSRIAARLSRLSPFVRSSLSSVSPAASVMASTPLARSLHTTHAARQGGEERQTSTTGTTPDNTVNIEMREKEQQGNESQSNQQQQQQQDEQLGDNLTPAPQQGKEGGKFSSAMQTQGHGRRRGGEMMRRGRDDQLDILQDPFRMFDRMSESLLKPFFSHSPFSSALAPFQSALPSLMEPVREVLQWDQELGRLVQTDLEEKDNEYVLNVKAPKFKKEELSLRLDGDVLTVTGHSEYNPKKGRHETLEFTRQLVLPDEVDVKGLSAKYDNGTLKVHLPKTETAKQSKKDIKIH